MQRYIFLFITLLSILTGVAQKPVQYEEHELSQVLNLWTQLQNAAGLGLSALKVHGVTELGYTVSGGDYLRAQEGNARSGLNFYSERFDRLGKNLVAWGSFNFVMDREKNRAWSDVIHTWLNNPYIFGSSVKGNYDRQMFDFHAKISTQRNHKFNFGLGIDYLAGDLSRLRDPRSRVFLADYAGIPSVTFSLNDHHRVGLNLTGRYQKEKLPDVSTVQDDPDLKYYTFMGMENAEAITGGYKGFERQFVSTFLGGDLQYSFCPGGATWLASAGVVTQNQEILQDIKQTPGSYHSLMYRTSLLASIPGNKLLWSISFNGELKQSAADEHLQELITVNDTITGVNSKTWVTLFTYKNRYISNGYQMKLKADLRNINTEKNDYSWMAGAEAGLNGFTNQYRFPFSEMIVNRMNAGIYGHYRLWNKNEHRWTVKAGANYEFGFDNKLTLNPDATVAPAPGATTYKQGTYDVANQVVLPDFEYFNTDVFTVKTETKYSLPLNFKKVKMMGFVKAYFEHMFGKSSKAYSRAGFSIGIIP